MARKRMIDPNIWMSEDFSKLSTLAKLVFIGMFSNADDEGRGRAKAIYLKSILFPYDEAIRVIDVDKTLSEIGSNMSVTFYSHNGNEYYVFDNWSKWQKVDKPTPSIIPAPEDDSVAIRGTFDEHSTNNRRTLPPNRIEQNRTEKKIFIKPTIDEIQAYCKERKNNVDAEKFYDFYESKGWLIGKNPMKDWKASVRTWERSNTPKAPDKPTNAYHNPTQNEFNDLGRFYAN